MGVKSSMENQLLLTGILNTLLPAVSSLTSITYTLIVLFIKRRNFQTKQNQFFIKRMNVCFKRIKKIAEVSLSEHSRKWEIYFAFCVTFLCAL